jgi:signal transduction histidine kinase
MADHRLGCRVPVRVVILAASPWSAAVADQPVKALAAAAAVVALTGVAAVVLRRINRRSRSLRGQVLAITLTALLLGAASAGALSWLMILDDSELGTVLSVLTVAAVAATGLVLLASAPLGRDAKRLEATVRRIEQGDREVRSDIDRVDELGHVAHALDDLTERLDQLEKEQTRFEAERTAMLSSVSHDLRTPIAALRVAVEALADGMAPDPRRYLSSMQRDIDALTSLVEDLFLLVRLDSGRYEMPATSVDLTEIIDEAIEALSPMAEDRNVKLILRAPGGVRIDGNAAALGRVIRNLLDNAIRHAPDGSAVSVIVEAEPPRVRVVDEGPGFPSSFADHAFEHFTRADSSRNRGTGGAGLGLAIARGVIEAHGGHIWLEEPPGGHVAFELPAA